MRDADPRRNEAGGDIRAGDTLASDLKPGTARRHENARVLEVVALLRQGEVAAIGFPALAGSDAAAATTTRVS